MSVIAILLKVLASAVLLMGAILAGYGFSVRAQKDNIPFTAYGTKAILHVTQRGEIIMDFRAAVYVFLSGFVISFEVFNLVITLVGALSSKIVDMVWQLMNAGAAFVCFALFCELVHVWGQSKDLCRNPTEVTSKCHVSGIYRQYILGWLATIFAAVSTILYLVAAVVVMLEKKQLAIKEPQS